jgi:hypothetical protein
MEDKLAAKILELGNMEKTDIVFKSKSASNLWLEDLSEFERELEKYEAKEREDEHASSAGYKPTSDRRQINPKIHPALIFDHVNKKSRTKKTGSVRSKNREKDENLSSNTLDDQSTCSSTVLVKNGLLAIKRVPDGKQIFLMIKIGAFRMMTRW